MKNRALVMSIVLLELLTLPAFARTKLAALPERAETVIRLDNPMATLIEEERILTLQAGLNKVDFSWNGVSIDSDSIRLRVLDHPGRVTLLNVSYPPGEAALVWEISCEEAFEERVRISYLLSNIDRLVAYKGVAVKDETMLALRSFLVLRNFSGEDFENARVLLDYGKAFERGIKRQETRRLLFFKKEKVPVEKIWTFDARSLPWDPKTVEGNVGIPVSYRIVNDRKSGFGEHALRGGKVRVFQKDGRGSTIFLGEDRVGLTPVGEKMKINIGDSRDIVVTQRTMKDKRLNVRKNQYGNMILHDRDVIVTAKIENFKDAPAVLTMIQHIPGQWDMKECTHEYKKKDHQTIEFEITLAKKQKVDFMMNYILRNLR